MLEQAEIELARGAKLVQWLGCTECHTVHGKGAGVRPAARAPEWADTLGTMVKIQGGEEVEITRDYLVTSIDLSPQNGAIAIESFPCPNYLERRTSCATRCSRSFLSIERPRRYPLRPS